MQHTLKDKIVFENVGLHSGQMLRATVKPVDANHGILFIRSDIKGRNNAIPGAVSCSVPSPLCTTLTIGDDVQIHTVEHLMSALNALGVDNAIISVNGPEIPFMDGSAIQFVEKIKEVGLEAQDAPKQQIKILKEVQLNDGDKYCKLSPSEDIIFKFEIDFPQASVIGKQKFEVTLTPETFEKEIAPNRSFGILQDVDYLREQGLIKGGSLENAVVVDGDKVLNPEGLRNPDEFVRHKILDAIGDLYLAGAQIIGEFEGYKCSHAMHSALLRKVFSDPESFEITVQP